MVLIDVDIDLGIRDGHVNRNPPATTPTYALTNSDSFIEIFKTTGIQESRGFLIFRGITIPQFSTIDDATLSIGIQNAGYTPVTHTITVEAIKSNDPATPTSGTGGVKVFTGTKATANAQTTVPMTTQHTGGNFGTIATDVKNIVQELVNAFNYNNEKMFFTTKTSTINANRAEIYPFELGTGSQLANLTINFTSTQVCEPTSDISNVGAWEDTTFGNSDTNLFDELDEGAFTPDDDTSAVRSPESPQPADTFEVKLDPFCMDPLSSIDHKIKIRVRGGTDVKIQLFEGATLRAESGVFSPTNSYQTFEYTLSNVEADSITDYSDLRIRVVPQ